MVGPGAPPGGLHQSTLERVFRDPSWERVTEMRRGEGGVKSQTGQTLLVPQSVGLVVLGRKAVMRANSTNRAKQIFRRLFLTSRRFFFCCRRSSEHRTQNATIQESVRGQRPSHNSSRRRLSLFASPLKQGTNMSDRSMCPLPKDEYSHPSTSGSHARQVFAPFFNNLGQ